jgi:hypothetical protein
MLRRINVLIVIFATFIMFGCGPGDPRFEAALGIGNGPFTTNMSRVIPAEELDNSDQIVTGWFSMNDLFYSKVIGAFPNGIIFSVIVSPSPKVILVNYYATTNNYRNIEVLNCLTKLVSRSGMSLGFYHNEYVPYVVYMEIRPDDNENPKMYFIQKPNSITDGTKSIAMPATSNGE